MKKKVKNIEWAIKEIEGLEIEWSRNYPHDEMIEKEIVLSILDQLDEPELTEQQISDWLYERNVVVVDRLDYEALTQYEPEVTEDQAWNKIAECYPAERVGLQNAFEYLYYGGFMTDAVVEKPVMPKFMAEYLDFAKSDTTLMRVLELAYTRNELEKWEKEYDWIEENHELFARAWLDGFTVEEEQRYKVELPTERLHHILTMHGDGKGHFFGKEHTNNFWYRTHLTEQEIKAIDERFWAFAVKVEEREAE